MKTVYYAISPSWNIIQNFISEKEVDIYLEKNPNISQIIIVKKE